MAATDASTSIEKRNPDVGWTVETLRVFHEQRFSDIEHLRERAFEELNGRIANVSGETGERFKESDLRYQQRFDAQGKALEAALTAADKAVTAALTAAKQLVDVALAAADKAVTKAETASEKRFEGVNEFRKSLSDQTATFLPRVEADQRFSSLEGRLSKTETAGSIQEGRGVQSDRGSDRTMWAVGIVISILLGTAALAVNLFKH